MTTHDQYTPDPDGEMPHHDVSNGDPSHRDMPKGDVTLEPWMLAMAREAVDELDASVTVPREMMWARIERERRSAAPRPTPAVAGTGTRRPITFRKSGALGALSVKSRKARSSARSAAGPSGT